MKVFLLVFIAFAVSQSDSTRGFCGDGSLHTVLTRAVVRSSDWLRQYYADNTTILAPYRACSMMAPLRLSGHQPHTLVNDFKNGRSMTITETVINYLDDQIHGNLSQIPAGRLAYIIMGVLAICENPNDFYGYNLYQPIPFAIKHFKVLPTFNNYFQYSLVAIALCNGRMQVPDMMVDELVRYGNSNSTNVHFVDTDSLVLMALTCVNRTHLVASASAMLIRKIVSKQNSEGKFGNQYSTALAAEALLAAGANTSSWSCENALRDILSYQNEKGSFGNVLANIQILPSLLEDSLIFLNTLECPAKKMISIVVKLSIDDNQHPVRNVTSLIISVANGTNAFTILQLAGERNPCYKATYKVFAGLGRYITSICSVYQDATKNLYWLIYENGSPAQFGVDQLKPKDGTRLTFVYKKVNYKKSGGNSSGTRWLSSPNVLSFIIFLYVYLFSCL